MMSTLLKLNKRFLSFVNRKISIIWGQRTVTDFTLRNFVYIYTKFTLPRLLYLRPELLIFELFNFHYKKMLLFVILLNDLMMHCLIIIVNISINVYIDMPIMVEKVWFIIKIEININIWMGWWRKNKKNL